MSNNNQQNDPLYQQARRAAQQQVNIDPLAANPNNNSLAAPRQLQLNDSNIMSARSSSPNASPTNTTNTNMQQQTTLKPTPTEPPIALQSVLNKNKLPSIGSNSTKININGGIYPLPINTNFVPGGLIYKPASLVSKLSNTSTVEVEEDGMVYLSEYSNSNVTDKNKQSSSPKNTTSSSSRARSKSREFYKDKLKNLSERGGLSIDTGETKKGKGAPQDIIHKALAADVTLHRYALLYSQQQQQQQEGSLKVGQRLPSLSGKVHGSIVLLLIAFIKTTCTNLCYYHTLHL